MAARCAEADPRTLALAGQGLRDVVRIAASDAGLWTEILTANAVLAREVLLAVAEQVRVAADVLAELASGNEDSAKILTALLEAGRHGIAAIPGKHGGAATDYPGDPG